MPTAVDWLSPGMPSVELILSGEKVNVIPHFLESLEVEVLADGAANKITITLFDPTWDTLENIVIFAQTTQGTEDAKEQYKNSIRFGWLNGTMSIERRFHILTYEPQFTAQGLRLVIKGTAENMDRHSRVYSRAFNNMTVSEIVQQILADDGWAVDIEPTSERYTLQQNACSNLYFINSQLKPIAKSAITGRTGYEFSMDGDTARFTTPDYSSGVKRRYLFGRDLAGEMVSFMPSFHGVLMFAAGGSNLKVTGHDVLGKRPIQTTVELGSAPRAKLNDKTIVDDVGNAYAGRHVPLPYTEESMVKAWAEAKFTQSRNALWQATSQVIGDPYLYPNDLVEVQVLKTSDYTPHYTSGVYRVRKVIHRVSSGSFFTDVDLQSDSSSLNEHDDNIGIEPTTDLINDGAPTTDSVEVESQPLDEE